MRHALLEPSSIVETFRLVATLTAEGKDIFGLQSGEPRLPVPRAAIEACHAALDRGATGYTPPGGLAALREVAARFYGAAHGVPLTPQCVVVHPGAKHALLTAAEILVEAGDEVVIPTPVWASHPNTFRSVGAVVRTVPCAAASGFMLDPKAVKAAFTSRTKALCIMTPSNPTGAVYPAELLREIATLCAERRIVMICDEIYREHCFDREFASPARAAYEAGAPFYVIEGVSKAYAMTGFRIGFSLADPDTARAADTYVSNTVTCASAPSQHAAMAAIEHGAEDIERMRSILGERRSVLLESLSRIGGVRIEPRPGGGIFVFAGVGELIGRKTPDGSTIESDLQLCNYLIRTALVASVPGSAFFAPGHLRLGFAWEPKDRLEEAGIRLKSAIETLR